MQKTVENLVNKGTDWRKWLVRGADFAAKWVEQRLHLYEKGKKLIHDSPAAQSAINAFEHDFSLSDEAVKEREDDPMMGMLRE